MSMDEGGAVPDPDNDSDSDNSSGGGGDTDQDSGNGDSSQPSTDDGMASIMSALSTARQNNGLNDQMFAAMPSRPAGPGGDQPNTNPFPTKTPATPFGKLADNSQSPRPIPGNGSIPQHGVLQPTPKPFDPRDYLPGGSKASDSGAVPDDSVQSADDGGDIEPDESAALPQGNDASPVPDQGGAQATPEGAPQGAPQAGPVGPVGPGGGKPQQIMRYLSGADAMPQQQLKQIEQQIDPQGKMNPTERTMAVIKALQQQDPKLAAAALQGYRQQYNVYAAGARKALDNGNMLAASHNLTLAHMNVPDGNNTAFVPAQGGKGIVAHVRKLKGGKVQGAAGGGAVQGFAPDGGDVSPVPDDASQTPDSNSSAASGIQDYFSGVGERANNLFQPTIQQNPGEADISQQGSQSGTVSIPLTPEQANQVAKAPAGPGSAFDQLIEKHHGDMADLLKTISQGPGEPTKNTNSTPFKNYDYQEPAQGGQPQGGQPQGGQPQGPPTPVGSPGKYGNNMYQPMSDGTLAAQTFESAGTNNPQYRSVNIPQNRARLAAGSPTPGNVTVTHALGNTSHTYGDAPSSGAEPDDVAAAKTMFPNDAARQQAYIDKQNTERGEWQNKTDVAKEVGENRIKAARETGIARVEASKNYAGGRVQQEQIKAQIAAAANANKDPNLKGAWDSVRAVAGAGASPETLKTVMGELGLKPLQPQQQQPQQGEQPAPQGAQGQPQAKPSPTDIQYLRDNAKRSPGLKTLFEARFGRGSAAQYGVQ